MAFEAVYGVLPASGFVAQPFSKFSEKHKQNREKPKIITGTRWEFYETRRTNAEAPFTVEMPLYYAMSCYLAALHFGAPATAAAFTSAFAHTFKPGGNTMLSGTFQYKRTGSQNAGEWYQMKGCEVNKLSLSLNTKGIPFLTAEGYGMTPTNIAAPSASTLAIEAYVHPDLAQFGITKGGSNWFKLVKIALESIQGIEPDWTLGSGVSPSRMKLGGASGTMKATGFQDDYTGSVMETNDGSGLLSQIIASFTGTDVIGTAGVPSIVITAPKPYVDDATNTDSDTDDAEDFSASLAYDSATASGWKWVFTNMLPASTFVGS